MSSMIKPVLGSQLQLGHPLACGLVGHWLFNENPGKLGIVNDLSGNGNTGTLVADTYSVPGLFGSALNFDGSGDKVNCGTPSLFSGKAGALSVWIYKTTSGVSRSFLAQDDYSKLELRVHSADSIRFYSSGAGGANYITSTQVLASNRWYHIFVQYDGTTAFIYIDGVLDISAAKTMDFSLGNGKDLGIGDVGGYPAYTGFIDHVMIYNRALMASEVTQLFMTPFCMFQRDMIELWAAASGVPAGVVPQLQMLRQLWAA